MRTNASVLALVVSCLLPSLGLRAAPGGKLDTARGKGDVPKVDIDPAKSTLDPSALGQILGRKPDVTGGVAKVTIGRTTKMHGQEVGNQMGVNTWAAFAGSDQQAIVDGDFAMYEDELQGVLKALRSSGINI